MSLQLLSGVDVPQSIKNAYIDTKYYIETKLLFRFCTFQTISAIAKYMPKILLTAHLKLNAIEQDCSYQGEPLNVPTAFKCLWSSNNMKKYM